MVDRLDGLPAATLKNPGAIDYRLDALKPRRPNLALGISVEVDPDRRHLRKAPPERLRVAHRADHFVAGLEQAGGQVLADEAASPRHEYAHGNAPGIRSSGNLREAG
jgi:hypothetical protein